MPNGILTEQQKGELVPALQLLLAGTDFFDLQNLIHTAFPDVRLISAPQYYALTQSKNDMDLALDHVATVRNLLGAVRNNLNATFYQP